MKSLKKYLVVRIFIFSLLLTQSCYFDLEEDTSSVLLIEDLKSEQDIIAALAPIYREFALLVDAPHEIQITEFGADDKTTWLGGNKEPLRVFDRFDYGDGENSDIPWLDGPWNGFWKIIYYSNTLISGLETSSAKSETITIADGEARFFRAMAYLGLVKRYGNMPIILEDDTPSGEETRASVLENYMHIEEDLLIAEQVLPRPGEVDEIGRASSAAAKAVLADLYLTWAGWPVNDESKYQDASDNAKEIIDMNYFSLLPIDELWLLQNQNSLESIFSVQFSELEDIRSNWSANTSFHESRGWSDLYPERQFFNNFPDGPRKDITFHTEIPLRDISNGLIVDQDPATKPWQESQRKHPAYRKFSIGENLLVHNRTVTYRALEIYRYAEILLIYAEASAHVSGGTASGEAAEAYNQVRRRAAGLPYDQVNGSDVSSVTVDEIVAEKGWELAGEGKRWWDLVRLEKVNDVIAIREDDEEVALSKSSVTWKQYIAPIPFTAISTSKLIQNPEGFRATSE